LSVNRQTFLPSTFTSKEYDNHFASFMFVPDFTPPATPASSPVLLLNSDPLREIMFPPSAVTVLLPPARSLDNETFGYGIGTGPGGVLQTSGMVAVVTPLLARCDTLRPFAFTVTDIAFRQHGRLSWPPGNCQGDVRRRAER
jgi:hypothetical protein